MKKIYVLILTITLMFTFLLFGSSTVHAEQIHSGSYLGELRYTTLDFSYPFDDSYKVDFLTPNSLGVGDDRVRGIGQIIYSAHGQYFGARDAFYNIPLNVRVYISSNELWNGNPRFNQFLLEYGEADTLMIFGNNLNFYKNGILFKEYTKAGLNSWWLDNTDIDLDSSVGSQLVYMRFKFDLSNSLEYQNGFNDGKDVGYSSGKTVGLIEGENVGYNKAYDVGYNDGVNDTSDYGIWSVFIMAFSAVGAILDIEILPNFSIGIFILIPLVFSLIYWLLGKRGGDK